MFSFSQEFRSVHRAIKKSIVSSNKMYFLYEKGNKAEVYTQCPFRWTVVIVKSSRLSNFFNILKLDFKASRQVGTLSILSHFLFCFVFFCTFVFLFVFLFVCFFKKNLTIKSLLTLYIVNKATIGYRRVGITQRRNSK